MKNLLKKKIRSILKDFLTAIEPNFAFFFDNNIEWSNFLSSEKSSLIDPTAKLYKPYTIANSTIGKYTYIAENSYISKVKIANFCSIGPNLVCGRGIHPMNGLSTHPMFYSTMKQNGITLCSKNKIKERKEITIGNDVFIGANVTILDGVIIGDGAVIGAGAVVSKDIPAYAIAVGVPIKIVRYRFNEEQIKKLKNIEWWKFDMKQLKDIENMFFEVNEFINKYDR